MICVNFIYFKFVNIPIQNSVNRMSIFKLRNDYPRRRRFWVTALYQNVAWNAMGVLSRDINLIDITPCIECTQLLVSHCVYLGFISWVAVIWLVKPRSLPPSGFTIPTIASQSYFTLDVILSDTEPGWSFCVTCKAFWGISDVRVSVLSSDVLLYFMWNTIMSQGSGKLKYVLFR